MADRDPPQVTANQILSSLSKADHDQLRPHLELVDMPSGKVLFKPGDRITHIYFPARAMVSVVAYTSSGQCVEAGVIGREGMAGVDVFLGGGTAVNEHIVQLPDGGWRAEAGVCQDLFDQGGDFQRSVLAFTRSMMLQISQTALCNRLHNINERLSRWLLMCHDRFDTDVLPLTQEFMSIMLGANRTTVTQAAIDLQSKGFIEYRRGRVKMSDRVGMEKFTCECYETVAKAIGDGQN